MTDLQVSRLDARHAPAIVDCFRRVYGESYANEMFYDVAALSHALDSGHLGSVGAIGADGRIYGHMAMTVHPGAVHVELGNTVVDPAARGGGLAWRVGEALSSWCRELGYRGFLHYPTTDHHIMQRRSVARGFETGLMLGYIPAETDGGVRNRSSSLRQAATIVYEAYAPGAAAACFVPERFADLLGTLVAPVGLARTWKACAVGRTAKSLTTLLRFTKRGLVRLDVTRCGRDLQAALRDLAEDPLPCRQVDFRLSDPAVDAGVEDAIALGFRFCGWLPGYRDCDVLRLQQLDHARTDLTPRLENPVARMLLNHYLGGSG